MSGTLLLPLNIVLTKDRSVTAHDVLAISLRAVLYYLGKNPAMRAKVRAEIRDAEVAGKLSQTTQQKETSDLEYVYVQPVSDSMWTD